MTVVQQSSSIFDIVPSIVILLGAIYIIFSISMKDLESSILPANSMNLNLYSIFTLIFCLLGYISGTLLAEEHDIYKLSTNVLKISFTSLIFLIIISKNRTNLFMDKIFSVFRNKYCFYFLLMVLPTILGFFSYFVIINGKLIDYTSCFLVLLALLLFIGKASVHNSLYSSLRKFYFSKEYRLFSSSSLTAYLVSENETFFFVMPFVEKVCHCNKKYCKNKAKEKSLIAINKSLVAHYEIAKLNTTKGK